MNLNMTGFIRMFYEASSLEDAITKADSIKIELEKFIDINEMREIKQYWKIPEHYEFACDFYAKEPDIDLRPLHQPDFLNKVKKR